MEKLRFLTPPQAETVREKFGTPAYVYDERSLRRQAQDALNFPRAFGLTVRYAMKAASNAAILRIFDGLGLHFDASSGFEVERALHAGIAPEKICLTAQELPANFEELLGKGIQFNACSMRQLETFGKRFAGRELGARFNPGLGSGGTRKTNTGGPGSSFGIWHEWLGRALEIARQHGLKIIRLHSHIGSGSDPEVWQRVALLNLGLVRQLPDARILNLGGGYKVGRMSDERSTDLAAIGAPVREALLAFHRETGRELHLEIEPGTFLVANAGALLAAVHDIAATGEGGHTFLKLDTGMTELLRPSLYGARHPIVVIPKNGTGRSLSYIVVGHCCESGDLLTPAPDQPDMLQERVLAEAAPGDLCVIEGAGAYAASMAAKNYNSFPEVPEVLLREDGAPVLIRRRQTLPQIIQNEIKPE